MGVSSYQKRKNSQIFFGDYPAITMTKAFEKWQEFEKTAQTHRAPALCIRQRYQRRLHIKWGDQYRLKTAWL